MENLGRTGCREYLEECEGVIRTWTCQGERTVSVDIPMETYQLYSAQEPVPAKSLPMNGNILPLTRTSIHKVDGRVTCPAMSVRKLPLDAPYETTRVRVALCLRSPGYLVTCLLILIIALHSAHTHAQFLALRFQGLQARDTSGRI